MYLFALYIYILKHFYREIKFHVLFNDMWKANSRKQANKKHGNYIKSTNCMLSLRAKLGWSFYSTTACWEDEKKIMIKLSLNKLAQGETAQIFTSRLIKQTVQVLFDLLWLTRRILIDKKYRLMYIFRGFLPSLKRQIINCV